MSEQIFEQVPVHAFAESAYLNYSMYVILDRALPHIGDGVKPVQRRIIYAMSELGLKATSKYKKSARTVGDVLGKFHPHGDRACYEAMVLMAQSFSYRYPLVDGQGNWGSPDDPKSFAAMRYTESRLSPYADLLLSELDQGTVEWSPNFDGTLKEPARLPSKVPNILLNGATGIAVGMSTDIPPHNLSEVVDAAILLLKKPKATFEEVWDLVPAPDFPTAAEIITPKEELGALYRSGNGALRMRAVYQVEDGDVVVNALPYQVSGSKVLTQIAAQMTAKKLPMVVDLRDESDHENPTRLVIVPKNKKVDITALMSHLFATTDLERTYRVNFNMIGLDGRPAVKGLRTILEEWISYRLDTVTKRTEFHLNKIKDRLHILEGLLVAFLNIDEVIEIIRKHDEPKAQLCKQFKLTETQAHAILEIKLRQLAKLEEMKLRSEQEQLEKERLRLQALLDSPTKLKNQLVRELTEIKKTYGDKRKSPVVARSVASALDPSAHLPTEPVTVILSEKGWIRSAKGHDVVLSKLNYKTGDAMLCCSEGMSNDQVILFDNFGRVYNQAAQDLPSARGYGEPVSSKLSPPSGAEFVSMFLGATGHYLILCDTGYGFVCTADNLLVKNKKGKAIFNVPKDSRLLPVKPMEGSIGKSRLALLSDDGYLLVIPMSELPELAKGKGNKLISLPKGKAKLLDFAVLGPKDELSIESSKRKLVMKTSDLKAYTGERARRGLKLPRGHQKATRMVAVGKNKG